MRNIDDGEKKKILEKMFENSSPLTALPEWQPTAIPMRVSKF